MLFHRFLLFTTVKKGLERSSAILINKLQKENKVKRYLLTFLFLMSCISHQAQATKKLNHNELAHEFISILNNKDLNQVEEFVVNNFSPDSLARWDGTGKDRYIGYAMNKALFHGDLSVISTELDTSNNRIRHISKMYSKKHRYAIRDGDIF